MSALLGRVSRDAEPVTAQCGPAIAKLGFAVDRCGRTNRAVFVSGMLFVKQGRVCAEHLSKQR